MDTDIYWPALCGDRNVYDAFWSYSLTINTTNPDLSNCFQQTALIWTPFLFLFLGSLLYVPFAQGALENRTYRLKTWTRQFRMICILLLLGLSLAQLIYAFIKQFDKNVDTNAIPVDYISAILHCAIYIYVIALEKQCYIKGIHSPALLFMYWFISIIFGIVTFRSKILQLQRGYHIELFDLITFYISYALILIVFVTCFITGKRVRVTNTSRKPGTSLGGETTPLLEDQDELAPLEVTGNMCPKLGASFISVITFSWFTRTIWLGYKKTFTMADMWDLRREDSCQDIVPRFEKYWNKELRKSNPNTRFYSEKGTEAIPQGTSAYNNGTAYGSVKGESKHESSLPQPDSMKSRNTDTTNKKLKSGSPSLVFALVKTFGNITISSGVILLGYYLTSLINPMLLRLLIAFVEEGDPYVWRGYIYAVAMFCTSVLAVLFMHHAMNLNYVLGMRVRTALISTIYKKAIRLSPVAKKNSTVGEIVNYMAVDTQKLQDAPMFFNYLWGSPLLVTLCMYQLWGILGPSSLAGLAFMLVILPVNSVFLAMKIRSLQKKQMGLKDGRIKLMNQILAGIKVLKLYAWEPHFEKKILWYRNKELANIRQGALLNAITYIVWFCSPFAVALLCFMTYVLSDPTHTLDASTAFVSMSLINLMSFPLTILPVSIMFLVQALVSVKRLSKFLAAEEIDPDNVQHDFSDENAVRISNGKFTWGEEGRISLTDINISVKPGKLVAVVGSVGSGKSSLLQAILGEMIKLSGNVNVQGGVSYVSQQAWIQNMTLKENIRFSKPLNEAQYSAVLEACALEQDLKILPAGDQTEIGERGINLSGGQKARVSLARAVYQQSDIYLFDDPLSAVDAHVGKHIFNKVIGADGLLRNKTRILVTNQLQYLPKVDEVIVLKDGRVSEMGSYEQLLEHNGVFAEFVRTYLKEVIEDLEDLDEEATNELKKLEKQISIISSKSGGDETASAHSDGSKSNLRKRRISKKSGTQKKSKSHMSVDKEELLKKKKKDMLIQDEKMEEGSVKFAVLKAYVSAASGGYVVLALVSLMCFIVFQVGTNIWLSIWSNDLPVNGTMDRELVNLRLGVYGGLGACQSLSVMGIAVGIALGSVSASRNLHHKLLANIFKLPMSFFDTTPLGRIVNRFSKDIDTLDVNLPQFSQNLMTTLAPLLSTFIMIIYSTPIFTAVFVPLAIFFFILQRVYVTAARQLKRLDAVKRSPIYAFFSESLNGASSIRAYKQQTRFMHNLERLLDENQKVWFEVFTSNRWVGIHAEMLGELVVLFAALFAVIQRDTLSPGLVGLSISFSLQVSLNLVMTVRSSCELETYIVAVERIKEYTELETEAPWSIPGKAPPRSWPDEGTVTFNNYSTKYRPELQLVLKGVTCCIQSKEKVGVVGRTGAGKSSMTLSLFRIIEACGGTLQIDGRNIADMGLHDVRSKLSIIPQDPVLFSGSLRFNIDPSDFYSNDEIWASLEHAHLKDFVSKLPNTLDYECGEDGANLSVGQKQLVCLARALLRKTKILVLDEATASIDLETDELIQSSIRTEFKECTVITIAHRLNTIMDYDRVIVMSEGEIKEFQEPNKLLQNQNSIFYGMAKDAGLV